MSTNSNNNNNNITGGAEGQDPSDYKPQLDEIAEQKWKAPEEQQQPQQSGIVDKILEYVPASVSEKIGLGKKQQQKPEQQEAEEPKEDVSAVPPHRPDDDEQIQEFLRDQHRSKEILGDDEDTKGV
ncbi:hypothetical protein QBC32DRAFT_348587 [Pseudoneurospora amorphoporcata]|uniref:Uncharacterized protein n=1 Tax=Pseudoneurospora amorphoporcata TaxID=241081 RepID=A0AAN6SDY2_9PEZI|nr:hypothetical protein QBC32DRAFT_348587 [Pseudoneurospora amorphoporcata]